MKRRKRVRERGIRENKIYETEGERVGCGSDS